MLGPKVVEGPGRARPVCMQRWGMGMYMQGNHKAKCRG